MRARALIFAALVSMCACDKLAIPTAPTSVIVPPSSAVPLPPAPPPTYTVSGVVSDGSAFAPAGLNTGQVSILGGELGGTSVPIFTGGAFTLRNIPPGNLTLSVSSTGYRTVEKTVAVDGDLKVNIATPRVAMSPQPSIAGTWAGTIGSGSGLGPFEISFTQSGAAVTGTWRAPSLRWSGTMTGTIDGERSVRGRIIANGGCSSSSDITFGLLQYDERRLFLSAQLCSAGNAYALEVSRTCRLVNDTTVSCS